MVSSEVLLDGKIEGGPISRIARVVFAFRLSVKQPVKQR
jgi:hypothetical protein